MSDWGCRLMRHTGLTPLRLRVFSMEAVHKITCVTVEAAGMEKAFRRLANWQLVACVFGLMAGFVPGVSFTGRFYGLDVMGGSIMEPADGQRARVT
ncbi:MAG: hypothetical protein JSS02_27365, partial [Planctomycetes bacterium]|nr:hypothetical protein [Planctomycetota bacterium]